jgi:hypothetical protein
VQDVWDVALCEEVIQPPPPGLDDNGETPETPEDVATAAEVGSQKTGVRSQERE